MDLESAGSLDLSDINIDLTYQDGLRLSELYGQLGKLQTQMDNLDFTILQDQLWITIGLLVLFAIIGFFVLWTLVIVIKDGPHADAKIDIGMMIYAVLVAVVIYFAMDYIATCTEIRLEGDIRSTQMQIDAILMKYGWTGI